MGGSMIWPSFFYSDKSKKLIFYSRLSNVLKSYSILSKKGVCVNRVKNPFIDDSIVSKGDYCPRKEVEEKILKKLESGHNLALIGDRRIGKTSTAHHVIDGMKGYYKVDIDLYHITGPSDLAESIIDACMKALSQVWDGKKVLDLASRFTPKVDITESGVSFGVGTKGQEYKKTLNVAFEFLNETVKRTKGKMIVLFDEFQAIKEVENGEAILKYMRGKIQKMTRVPFMYVGSIRHEMDHIFRDQSSAFFKQAEIIYFEHIEADIFYKFIQTRFKKKKIVIEKNTYNHLYKTCYGITGDIQTFCRVAFDSLPEGTLLDTEVFFVVLEIIYKNEQKYFKKILDEKELTKIQKNLLTQLAGTQEKNDIKLFGKDFQKTIGVKSPGAVTNALNALEKKEYIYKPNGQYYFTNPFFKEWILDYRYFIRTTAGNLTASSPFAGTRIDFGYRQRLNAKSKLNS